MTWGQYAVTGTFDGTTFTVTDAIPAALYDAMAEPEAGGLGAAPATTPVTTDTEMATPEDLDATLAAASALPTYATAWLSDSTINVAVTEDPEGAEAELRKTWGGLLCVTTVERTDADLNTINQELQAALGDQLLTSGSHVARLARRPGRLRRRVDPGVGRRDVRRGPGADQLGADAVG